MCSFNLTRKEGKKDLMSLYDPSRVYSITTYKELLNINNKTLSHIPFFYAHVPKKFVCSDVSV
jgi:hypothetical protein